MSSLINPLNIVSIVSFPFPQSSARSKKWSCVSEGFLHRVQTTLDRTRPPQIRCTHDVCLSASGVFLWPYVSVACCSALDHGPWAVAPGKEKSANAHFGNPNKAWFCRASVANLKNSCVSSCLLLEKPFFIPNVHVSAALSLAGPCFQGLGLWRKGAAGDSRGRSLCTLGL